MATLAPSKHPVEEIPSMASIQRSAPSGAAEQERSMFKKLFKTSTVMALVISAMAMVASAAGASTWHSNLGGLYGGTAYNGQFTASSGAASSLTVGTAVLSCRTAAATGTLQSGSGTTTSGTTYASGTGLARGTVTFASCTSGGTTYGVSGTYSLNATSAPTSANYAAAAGTAVAGTLGSLSINVSLVGRTCETVTGSLGGTYNNPRTLTGTPPTGTSTSTDATLVVGSGSLTVAASGTCALPSGTGSYTGQSFSLTSASPQPVVWTP
jgi:hypothetical protein